MKTKTQARCQSCGATTPRWVGRCPECGEWGTVVEESVARSPASAAPAAHVRPTRLADHEAGKARRLPTGIDDVDAVLGGGLVAGAVVLLAGEPGVGKSTLTLQLAASMCTTTPVLLVCGEESPEQIRERAKRLGNDAGNDAGDVVVVQDTSIDAVVAALGECAGGVAIIDSVQTVFDPEIGSAPGSVSQVRECGARLARVARETSTSIVLVGHVTKDGSIAGPRVLEHLVDVVLTVDGDRQAGLRVLRAVKNRFGSTHEAGFFEMTGDGLVPIRDASRYLLQDRCPGLAGSVLAACVEGRRPFLIEVQALVGRTHAPAPRRTAIGVDAARLPLLVAVVERRLNLRLDGMDVYVSAVGGIRASEPACDLAVVLALLSARHDVAVPSDLAAFGEVGLAGEVRHVAAADRRLAEAKALGCRTVLVPASSHVRVPGLDVVAVRHVRDLLGLVERHRQRPPRPTLQPVPPS